MHREPRQPGGEISRHETSASGHVKNWQFMASPVHPDQGHRQVHACERRARGRPQPRTRARSIESDGCQHSGHAEFSAAGPPVAGAGSNGGRPEEPRLA